MSLSEFRLWQVYRNRVGSLDIGRRIEQAVGNALSIYMQVNGARNVSAYDFMPHETKPQLDLSFDEAMMKAFGGN